jgi:hypothetical protein
MFSLLSGAHAQPAHLEAIGWGTTPGAFQLRLASPSDAHLRVDYSDDLVKWEFLQALPSQEPPAELSDSQAFRSAHRFYRALPTEEIVGESKRLGNGTVRSWVRLDDQGNPAELGVTFSSGALMQLPSSGTEIVLRLPSVPAVPPFDHIGINWNPNGHPPAGVYNQPHFDVHFYLVTLEERNLITSTAKMYVAPAPEFLPQDYELSPNSGDSRMGSHWWDAEAPELHGHGFDHTFIFGFYDGALVFLEPMVTLNYLNTQPAFRTPIKQPNAWQKPGLYPSDYRIDHDAKFEEYTVALTNLLAR